MPEALAPPDDGEWERVLLVLGAGALGLWAGGGAVELWAGAEAGELWAGAVEELDEPDPQPASTSASAMTAPLSELRRDLGVVLRILLLPRLAFADIWPRVPR